MTDSVIEHSVLRGAHSRRRPDGPATQILRREGELHRKVTLMTFREWKVKMRGAMRAMEGNEMGGGLRYLFAYIAKVHHDAYSRASIASKWVVTRAVLCHFFATISIFFGYLAVFTSTVGGYWNEEKWYERFDSKVLEIVGRVCFLYHIKKNGKARWFCGLSVDAYEELGRRILRNLVNIQHRSLAYLWMSQMYGVSQTRVCEMVKTVREYYEMSASSISAEHAHLMRAFLNQFEDDPDTRMPRPSEMMA